MSAGRRPGLAVAEETTRRFAGFTLDLRALRTLERLLAELGRHQLLDLELLLGGKCEQLVRRLRRLQSAFGALAPVDDRFQRLGIVANILDDAALHAHRLARSEERRVGKECFSTCNSWWPPYT